MNKGPLFLLILAFLFSGCVGMHSVADQNIFPDLDFVVWKQRAIRDENDNRLHLTLVGLKRHPSSSFENDTVVTKKMIDVYVVWELRKKTSTQYKISFTTDGGNSDFFIRTAAGKICGISAVAKGPTAPGTLAAESGQGGLLIFTFPDFDPEANPLFDMVEGGRRSVDTAAYRTYIKDPARWSFFGCRAIRGGK